MSTNALKLLALICMVLDHIGEFYPQSPVWLHYVGRLSAPLFFYCSAWGFYYTGDKKKYLVRLYIMGLLMSAGNIIISYISGEENGVSNNIFVTIFLGCLIVYLLERAGSTKGKIKCLALIAAWQIIAFVLCVLFAELWQIPQFIDIYMLYYTYGALFGSVIFTEGSIWFVLFFVAVYFLKDKKMMLSVFVLFFAAGVQLLIRRTYYMRGPATYLVPFYEFQWMMIVVIPFYWIYNGKKGKGMKWFYYLFYPLHIWALYLLGRC